MKKLSFYSFAIALLVSALMTGATAATRQIAFAKGKTSASVSGKVKGNDSMDYSVRASAGQTMTVDFKGSKGAAYFNVLPPGSTGEAIFVGSASGNHFQGVLPSDGEYIVRVYLMGAAEASGKPVSFKLTVAITGNGKSNGAASSTVAEKACLAAVAKEVGVDVTKLKVKDVSEAESGISVQINVPEATAPWSCLSDKKGHVQGTTFTGSEGYH